MKVGDRVRWSKVHGPIIRNLKKFKAEAVSQPAIVVEGVITEVRDHDGYIKVDTGNGQIWLDPAHATITGAQT